MNDSSDTVKKMIFNEIVALKSQLHVREHKVINEKQNIPHCQNSSKIYHTVRIVLKYTTLSE